ncbi:MAG: phosphatase PAP2 family protein [Candidatus Micrarchaeia archaeon]
MQLITQINDAAFHAVKAIASVPLNQAMQVLGPSFVVVLPLLVIYLLLRHDKNVFALVAAGVLLYVVSDTIKLIVKEPRPCDVSATGLSWINAPACESSFSFPSNHASVLTGLALFTSKYKYVRIAYVVWLAIVLFGRVYLGLHYFTDVLAGMAISIIISYAIYEERAALARIGLRVLPFLKRWFWE